MTFDGGPDHVGGAVGFGHWMVEAAVLNLTKVVITGAVDPMTTLMWSGFEGAP